MGAQKKLKIQLSVYLKIFLNYSQIVSILISINNNLPAYSQRYFEISSMVTSFSSRAFSIDCFIYYFHWSESPLHIKALMFVIFPFILWLILFMGALLKKMRGFKFQKEKLTTYFLIISNFLQPFILQQLIDNLKCKKIGNSLVIYKQMNFQCDSKNHLKWVYLKKIIIFFKCIVDLFYDSAIHFVLDCLISNRLSALFALS